MVLTVRPVRLDAFFSALHGADRGLGVASGIPHCATEPARSRMEPFAGELVAQGLTEAGADVVRTRGDAHRQGGADPVTDDCTEVPSLPPGPAPTALVPYQWETEAQPDCSVTLPWLLSAADAQNIAGVCSASPSERPHSPAVPRDRNPETQRSCRERTAR